MFFKDRRALITGASTGLGAGFAEALAAAGTHLVLVARSGDKLAALAARLRAQHGVQVETLAQDLVLAGAVDRVWAAAGASGQRIDILINNAGFGTLGRFETLPLERQLQQIMLNVGALTELCHRCLPAMQQRRFGAILNVASTAGLVPIPYMATYSATKAFVLSLSEALWAENRALGVHVTALCPGPVQTEFFASMGAELPAASGPKQSIAAVVRCGLQALQANKSYVVSGLRNYMAFAGLRLLPRQQAALLVARQMCPAARQPETPKPA